MKKLFLLLFMFAFLANIKGQDYIPLLKEGNQWNVYRDFINPLRYTEIFKFDFDTVVDNRICKKIVSTSDSSISAVYSYRCLMFEDSITKKIYSLDNQNNVKLYFDFSAQSGDSLALYSPYYNTTDTFIVSQVSTVDINSINRKKITLDYFSSNYHLQNVDSWIEGIGSLKGLVYGNTSPQFVGSQYSLLCFSNYSQILYPDQNSGHCYYTNVKIEEMYNNPIKIYPNPVEDVLSISDLPLKKLNLKIIDLCGNLLVQKEINEENNRIFVANLKPGMYLITICDKEKTVLTQKIVKR